MDKTTRQRAKLLYPRHFVESTVFTKRWKELGLNEEADLMALQLEIMASPRACPVVRSTGGLRMLRFVPPTLRIDERAGYPVCYVYFEEYGLVYLVYVYDKREKHNLDAAKKKAIRSLISREKAVFNRRTSRRKG